MTARTAVRNGATKTSRLAIFRHYHVNVAQPNAPYPTPVRTRPPGGTAHRKAQPRPALVAALYPEPLRDPLRTEPPAPPVLVLFQAVGAFASLSAHRPRVDHRRAPASGSRAAAGVGGAPVRRSADPLRRIVPIHAAWFRE